MSSKRYALIPMVPGPVSLHPAVLKIMSQDYGSGQIEDDFLPFYADTAAKLARLAGTKNDVVLMTGEGMLALWAALKSCLKPGDKVLALGTGVFGDGIGQMAASFGCELKALSFDYNSTINTRLEQIEQAAAAFKPKMITVVHCETPSGTLNPLAELGAIKKRLGIPLLYVDAVSSWGGVEIKADDWNIDLLLGGSQKCFSAPPSMSMVAVSDTAWQIMQDLNYQGYDAMLPFRGIHQAGRCPYTPYWHGIAALNASAQAILDEGLPACAARHEQVATQCRNGLAELGIDLFPTTNAVCSPTVTAALIPAGFEYKTWQKTLRTHGLITAGSFGPMLEKVFRLGHMGVQANSELMQQALDVIKLALNKS